MSIAKSKKSQKNNKIKKKHAPVRNLKKMLGCSKSAGHSFKNCFVRIRVHFALQKQQFLRLFTESWWSIWSQNAFFFRTRTPHVFFWLFCFWIFSWRGRSRPEPVNKAAYGDFDYAQPPWNYFGDRSFAFAVVFLKGTLPSGTCPILPGALRVLLPGNKKKASGCWLRCVWHDSNVQPADSKSDALSGWATNACK